MNRQAIAHGTFCLMQAGGWGVEAISCADGIAGCGLWSRGIWMGLQAGAYEKMLLLTGGVLCSNLLAVDALYRHAFIVLCVETIRSAYLVTVTGNSNSNAGYNTVNTDGDNTFGFELDKRRMDVLIDGPTHILL
jgi:hypothetical protein